MEVKRSVRSSAASIAAAALMAAAALLLGVALTGCAAQDEPEPAPEPVQEAPAPEPEPEEEATEPEPEKLAIPNHSFISNELTYDGQAIDHSIGIIGVVDLEGNRQTLENPDMLPMGNFAEGYAFVKWETSEYDEEWDTEYDQMTHYGLVDETGKLAVDLTETVHSFEFSSQGSAPTCEVTNAPMYEDGCMVLCLSGAGIHGTVVVLDEQGKVKFTIGDSGRYDYADEGTVSIAFDVECENGVDSCSSAYSDGVIVIDQAIGGGSMVVDTEGNVLYEGEAITHLGNGYVIQSVEDGAYVVQDYDGNVVFDPSSVEVPGDIEGAYLDDFTYESLYAPASSGFVAVGAEKVNPHGGANKQLTGLYCVSTETWVVPLTEGKMGFNGLGNGLVEVTLESKALLTGGEAPENADVDDEYSCVLDAQGNVVLDAESPEVADVDLSTRRFISYLGDDYWMLPGESVGPDVEQVIVLIDDAKVEGAVAAPDWVASSGLYK